MGGILKYFVTGWSSFCNKRNLKTIIRIKLLQAWEILDCKERILFLRVFLKFLLFKQFFKGKFVYAIAKWNGIIVKEFPFLEYILYIVMNNFTKCIII